MRYLIMLTLLLSQLTHSIELEKEYKINLGGWSRHFSPDEDVVNENHKMFAVESSKLYLGAYENSYNKRSVFMFRNFRKDEVSFGFGAVSGYSEATKECPIKIKSLCFAAHVSYSVPKVPLKVMLTPHAVVLALEFTLSSY